MTRVGVALRAGLRRTTLRHRLIAVLLACLLFACAIVAVVTIVALRSFLTNRLDQQLESAAARNLNVADRFHRSPGPGPGIPFGVVVGQPVGTFGAQVEGHTVVQFGLVGGQADSGRTDGYLAARRVIGRLRPDHGPRTVQLPAMGTYRVLAITGPSGDVLVTGLPESQMDQTVRHLLYVELLVFAGTLLVTGVVAAGLVRLSLRPLTRVASTAAEVADTPLSSGVVQLPAPVPNPTPGTEAGQVADAMNRMMAHVQHAFGEREAGEQRLRRFVADASHELRTPVAIIASHAEFAQRANGDTDGDVGNSLERIRVQTARMTTLVDDLLLLARLDSGRPLRREPVDLTRLALDATRDAQVSRPQHRWQLDLPDVPVTVTGDEPTLHQAVGNLLANAGTHTPDGTTIRVALMTRPGEVALHVADDGPGIPAELQSRLFERFVHGTSSQRPASGGYGLGLPIVAAIVHAHHGTIEVASVPGGTSFVIRLPAEAGEDS